MQQNSQYMIMNKPVTDQTTQALRLYLLLCQNVANKDYNLIRYIKMTLRVRNKMQKLGI